VKLGIEKAPGAMSPALRENRSLRWASGLLIRKSGDFCPGVCGIALESLDSRRNIALESAFTANASNILEHFNLVLNRGQVPPRGFLRAPPSRPCFLFPAISLYRSLSISILVHVPPGSRKWTKSG
jgi:hypothetical protein